MACARSAHQYERYTEEHSVDQALQKVVRPDYGYWHPLQARIVCQRFWAAVNRELQLRSRGAALELTTKAVKIEYQSVW